MAADHPPDQPVVSEVVEPALLAVALAGGIHQRQVARMADTVSVAFLTFHEALLQRDGDVLRKSDADEARGGNGVAVANQLDRLAGAHHFAGVAAA